MERGRGQRSLIALMVAATAALLTFYLMDLTGWAPGDPAADSRSQAILGAVVVGLAVAVPRLLWIWSRPDTDVAARRDSRLLRQFNTEVHHDHRHDSDRDQF
ncbi:MAG TPA: hypothetical protein DCY40_08145 [Actinobacteria bacterium]|nr:hypothetical protein [Actinomycetota bacterium]